MQRRRMQIDDLYNCRWLSDPQITPEGDRIACVVRYMDRAKNRYFAHLWLVRVADGDSRALTRGEVEDHSPRWHADGDRLAFARKADDADQILLLRLDGGEPVPLTNLDRGGIHDLVWSPDGKRIAFIWSPKPPPVRAPGDMTLPGAPPPKPPPGWRPPEPVCRVITALHYREEGRGWMDDARKDQLFVLDVATREVKQLTKGRYDVSSPAWSPDGARIVFSSNRQKEPPLNPLLIDLWSVSAHGGPLRLIRTQKGPAMAPSFSPDGRRIAYHGHAKPECTWGAANNHVWVVDAKGGNPRDAMPKCDRTVENATISDMKSFHGPGVPPIWSRDGRSVVVTLSDDGNNHLVRVNLANGRVDRLTKGALEVLGFSANVRRDRFALAAAHPLNPGELWLVDAAGKSPRLQCLTQFNTRWLKAIDLAVPERFTTSAPGGPEVTGWFMRPRGFKTGRKYPMAYEVHGGPRAQYGNTFFHEFQVLAAEGFVVAYGNPRGGQGRGEAFADAITGEWGNKDYVDCLALVDAMVAKGFVDPKRMGILGGSYGGYMTSWAIGQTTRFRAAVSMRSVNNLHSMAGTSDFGFDDWREFGARPWEDPMKLLRQSPIHHVAKIRTPLLILHSEGDLRCPIEQAEQFYLALKQLRRPVEFVRFPEENHDLSRIGRPDRRIERLRRIADWLNHHLRGKRRAV